MNSDTDAPRREEVNIHVEHIQGHDLITFRNPEISKLIRKDIRDSAKDRKDILGNLSILRQEGPISGSVPGVKHLRSDTAHENAKRLTGMTTKRLAERLHVQKAHLHCAWSSMPVLLTVYMLDLTTNPSAAETSLMIVPVTMSPADLMALFKNPTNPNHELGLDVGCLVVMNKNRVPDRIRKMEESVFEGKPGMGLPMVTFVCVAYEGDEQLAITIDENTSVLMQIVPILPEYLTRARAALLGYKKSKITKDNVDELRSGFNNDVRNDKTNKMKLRGEMMFQQSVFSQDNMVE
ncbi:hypothetical protein F5876DRAFT_69920 [Lentinula aff. lateritia]|uniref:Uncharacterized protein n=1 Tax=Lentinula aff. lateritia TaxID=2804960 RepID=A0ACC1TKM2_9AGAR|nr:hypothetical protein F5876DRAFT_69920 [Lentinula aff. lateritia]